MRNISQIFLDRHSNESDYSFFVDVVTFDTMYMTNKDYRPLGVFIGFNHHRQIVVFGASLLYEKIVKSFMWLFENVLETMLDKY